MTPRDLIPFRSTTLPPAGPQRRGPDLAITMRRCVQDLVPALAAAEPFRAALAVAAATDLRWRVPALVFFHPRSFERPAAPLSGNVPEALMLSVARRFPAAAEAWADLRPKLAHIMTL
ncbi:MAG: hypothetical protein ACRCZF_02505 [Gemmataceae bacterium]